MSRFETWQQLKNTLSFSGEAFINGKFVPARSAKTLNTINPASGETLLPLADCNKEDVDDAVAAAREVFHAGDWRKLPPAERKRILLNWADLLEKHQENLALLESLDSGKPINECLSVDIPESITVLRWHAELVDKLYDQSAPVGDNALTVIIREPIGVVGCVLPWNFPLLMLAWKIGPALASGCSVIVKPAEQTSLTALWVAELGHQAGIPAGVLNIVTGTGQQVGEPIGLHSDIDMVSFTGSTQTGRRFLRYSADSNLKKVVLECGGKNPAVVFNDIDDIDEVAQHILNGALWNMGENCSATSRLIVQKQIKPALLERLKSHIVDWKLGDPSDRNMRLGTMISEEHFAKVNHYLDLAKQEELTIIYGGNTFEGKYIQPTLIDDVTPESALFNEEIFGPILTITSFETVEEAIILANDTPYGLAASVYTSNINKALNVSRAIRAGTVTVNTFGEGDVTTPFGGYKLSGFGGRDKSIHAHDQYTELKTIWIDTPV